VSASAPDGDARVASRPRGWAQAFSGVLVAGLLVLFLGLLVVWVVARANSAPGPGPAMLTGHGVGAVAALVLHRVALRRTDRIGYAAAFGPVAVLLLLGLTFWWS
jgi:hypothetical protein